MATHVQTRDYIEFKPETPPQEGGDWLIMYKIVPPDVSECYPSYKLHHQYKAICVPKMCSCGFHASPSFAACRHHYLFTPGSRLLKVLVKVVDKMQDDSKVVGSELYVLEEKNFRQVADETSRVESADQVAYVNFDGACHRIETDGNGHVLPAVVKTNGDKYWYTDGRLNRRDAAPETGHALPAVMLADGTQEWLLDGVRTRTDRDPSPGRVLPAVIRGDGAEEWWLDGELRRDDVDENGDELPAAEYADGTKIWYVDGRQERAATDGDGHTRPSYESATRKEWRVRGQLHRVETDSETGLTLPAVEQADGTKIWSVNGCLNRPDKDPATGRMLPAVITPTVKQWYVDNVLSRTDKDDAGLTLPASESADGTKIWSVNGVRTRTDVDKNGRLLPSVIYRDGTGVVMVNGRAKYMI